MNIYKISIDDSGNGYYIDFIITTSWGSKAVCLKGGYIVTYNAEENDFNSVEQGAKRSTYADVSPKQKVNS